MELLSHLRTRSHRPALVYGDPVGLGSAVDISELRARGIVVTAAAATAEELGGSGYSVTASYTSLKRAEFLENLGGLWEAVTCCNAVT